MDKVEAVALLKLISYIYRWLAEGVVLKLLEA